jgi:hypothetical protein
VCVRERGEDAARQIFRDFPFAMGVLTESNLTGLQKRIHFSCTKLLYTSVTVHDSSRAECLPLCHLSSSHTVRLDWTRFGWVSGTLKVGLHGVSREARQVNKQLDFKAGLHGASREARQENKYLTPSYLPRVDINLPKF